MLEKTARAKRRNLEAKLQVKVGNVGHFLKTNDGFTKNWFVFLSCKPHSFSIPKMVKGAPLGPVYQKHSIIQMTPGYICPSFIKTPNTQEKLLLTLIIVITTFLFLFLCIVAFFFRDLILSCFAVNHTEVGLLTGEMP